VDADEEQQERRCTHQEQRRVFIPEQQHRCN